MSFFFFSLSFCAVFGDDIYNDPSRSNAGRMTSHSRSTPIFKGCGDGVGGGDTCNVSPCSLLGVALSFQIKLPTQLVLSHPSSSATTAVATVAATTAITATTTATIAAAIAAVTTTTTSTATPRTSPSTPRGGGSRLFMSNATSRLFSRRTIMNYPLGRHDRYTVSRQRCWPFSPSRLATTSCSHRVGSSYPCGYRSGTR